MTTNSDPTLPSQFERGSRPSPATRRLKRLGEGKGQNNASLRFSSYDGTAVKPLISLSIVTAFNVCSIVLAMVLTYPHS
jgi:hypothetical protein